MQLSLFHALIFGWFRKNGRILPWREKLREQASSDPQNAMSIREHTLAGYFTNAWRRDPYRVAVSELMLQQTQVDRVLPKFEEFLKRWPTVRDLANASRAEVLIAWQGLGYNRRARFLHEMAQAVVQSHDGIFPETETELQTLPGIGAYTARAILAFAHGKDVGVIDTNIRRIFSRVMFGTEEKSIGIPPKEFTQIVDESVPKGKGDPWNQALMDFGALVCIARAPKCSACPLQTVCLANQEAKKEEYTTYAEKLHKAAPKSIQTKKIPYQNSDRYFRGRIVDKLREGAVHMEDLRMFMEKNHDLTDRLRWGLIVEKLVIDRLIQIKGSTVELATG